MLTNATIAELLARAAEGEREHRARALRRAARAAMRWEDEAAGIASSGRSLTELRAVGPWIARTIHGWLEDPPEPSDPPPERTGFLSFAEARATVGRHPEWADALRSDLQTHSTWSDGKAPLEDMASSAAALGRTEVAVTDHSKGLRIARGMDEPTLLRQGPVIRALDRKLRAERSGPRLLHGIEMNLSPEGEGDMEPEALRGLDLVLGAFHSRLRVTDDQTDRYLAAVRNPLVDVLAHPRGRRWDARLGLRADWPRVFEAAAEAGTAVEIDAHPDRQDLDVGLLGVAAEAGAWISIGTDAHHPEELRYLDLGVAAAARAGVPRERVLNLLDRDGIRAWRRR